MKILRLFDSLRFVRAIFVAVACVFILNVAHAATTAIQSVIAYGKTEQNGTPTPTNPAPIMTNNGVLKVNSNLFDINTVVVGKAIRAGNTSAESPLGSEMDNAQWSCSDYIRVQPNTIYTYVIPKSANASAAGMVFYSNKSVESAISGITQKSSLTGTFTTPANCNYVRFSWVNSDGNAAKLVQGTSADGIYTDGLTETLRDAAGHKATAEMLLSVGDYKDEQNITTGAITRRVGVKVLDGSENWIYRSDYNVFSWPGIGMMASGRPTSTHFPYRPYTATGKYGVGYIYYTELFIKNTDYATPAEFKAYLAEQYANGTPVIVVYPLATETTENVTAQSLTTAPVRQTLGAIMNMPIKTILTDNTEIMSGANELIKIATTKYNEESFEDVQGALTGVFNAVDTVVSQTMTQAQAIDTIATSKQTRPDEGCSAKYCLLVEDEDGTPHWYPIAGANGVAHNLPAGYTELQYIESTGTQYIDTGIYGTEHHGMEIKYSYPTLNSAYSGRLCGGRTGASAANAFAYIGTNLGTLAPTNNAFYMSSNNGPAASLEPLDTNVHTASVNFSNNQKSYFDGQEIQGIGETTAYVHQFTTNLFRAYNGTSGWATPARARIYFCKITNSGELVRDFVPAKNSNNVVGLYDMVSGTFFTNDGTGDFTAGPDM